jgi:hypothetical protein
MEFAASVGHVPDPVRSNVKYSIWLCTRDGWAILMGTRRLHENA